MWNPKSLRQLKQAGGLATVGIELGLSVALGVVGGHWIDEKLETSPAFLFAGLALGLIAGFRRLFQLAKRHAHKPDTPPYDPPDSGYDASDDASDSEALDPDRRNDE
ncbi:MAG: AtpZ/AtpI family protein [Sandaracinaceae bacterium]